MLLGVRWRCGVPAKKHHFVTFLSYRYCIHAVRGIFTILRGIDTKSNTRDNHIYSGTTKQSYEGMEPAHFTEYGYRTVLDATCG